MLSKVRAFLALALLVLPGCGTPSVHPVWSPDRSVSERGLVGTWRPVDEGDKATYTVSERPEAYRLLVRDNDAKNPEEWEFELKLVQLGEARFADVAVVPDERERVGERWSTFFVPTHMFVKFVLDGDTLRVWTLKREFLNGSSLLRTALSSDVDLITAPTAELQKFLEAAAGRPEAFGEPIELRRVKPQ